MKECATQKAHISYIIILFILSLFIVFALNALIYPISNLLLHLPIVFWANSDNARYILSALSQAQAAIFGIFFTLVFIITQIQVQNKGASPHDTNKQLDSEMLSFIFFIFIVSITVDLLLLRYIDSGEIIGVNIFWPLSLSVFGILLLFLYMKFRIKELFKNALIEEILSGNARYNLHGADLRNAPFSNVSLKKRNLRRAHMEGANLNEAHLEGAHLERAHLERSRLGKAHLEEAYLGEANLEGAGLWGAHLSGAYLNGTFLSRAHLSEAHLNGTFLSGANLEGALLSGADLEGAFLGATNLLKDLLKENFDTEVLGAYLHEEVLLQILTEIAYLYNFDDSQEKEVNLNGAILRGADLEGANLVKAVLCGANLKGANLKEANLENALVHKAHFEDISYDDYLLESLLLTKGIDTAFLDHKLRDDLKSIGKEILAHETYDPELKPHIRQVLDSI